MKVDDALQKLRKARKRLQEDQGRIARRNARQAYLQALRTCRKAVDEQYPVIRKPVKRRRKPSPKRAIRNKTRVSEQMHRQLLAAGVSPSQFIERGKAGNTDHAIYAPRWMVRAYRSNIAVDVIARAVRSQKVRRRINTILRLGHRGNRTR